VAPLPLHESFAQVDATENPEVAEKHGVEGYPTLKFFKGGRATEYSGGRTEKDIVAWVRKHSGPPAKTVTSVEEAKTFADAAEVAVVGVFASTDSAEAKVRCSLSVA
jgi:protein disulfide-isomerase A1